MTQIWAHRGSTGPARENTLEAFEAARQRGADGVELDVRRTRDGVLVVHHDADLPSGEPIQSSSAADLPAFIPTLSAALEAAHGLAVNVEVKTVSAPLEELAADDRATALETGAICASWQAASDIVVSSFSLPALAAIWQVAPGIEVGLLIGNGWRTTGASGLIDTVAQLGYHGLHPEDSLVDEELARGAERAGISLRVWTVDDPIRIAGLAQLGVEAVITNDVAAARQALGRDEGAP